jgi:lipid-A-disaccharide synthase
VVLIASGTATLEALLHKRPMVVAYRVASLTYRLLRRFMKTAFFSLPNLLAGRQLVPELIQDAATPQALADALTSLLDDGQDQTEGFAAIHVALRQDASTQAAEAVLQLVNA